MFLFLSFCHPAPIPLEDFLVYQYCLFINFFLCFRRFSHFYCIAITTAASTMVMFMFLSFSSASFFLLILLLLYYLTFLSRPDLTTNLSFLFVSFRSASIPHSHWGRRGTGVIYFCLFFLSFCSFMFGMIVLTAIQRENVSYLLFWSLIRGIGLIRWRLTQEYTKGLLICRSRGAIVCLRTCNIIILYFHCSS